jgi:hypothetical protein
LLLKVETTMNRDAIEVGAFSWARIQRLYDADAVVHWERCEAEGLQCPQEVFTQLFHPEHVGVTAAVTAERSSGPLVSDLKAVMAVDWGRVSWELAEFSGVALGTCGWNGNINMP